MQTSILCNLNYITGNTVTEHILVTTLKTVLEDDSFKIKTPALIKIRQTAEKMLEWCLHEPNKDQVEEFGKKLTRDLQGVILASNKSLTIVTRKKCGDNIISYGHQQSLLLNGMTFSLLLMPLFSLFYINI